MGAPVTPDEWLTLLTRRLDERRPRVQRLRSYVDGDAPLPEGTPNTREAWRKFQAKARTNFGALIVDAVADRLICNGVYVGDSTEDDDRARRLWRENRLDVALSDAIRDMLICGVGYGVVGVRDGRPVMTAEPPELMYASTDPERPWLVRAAVKVWRDLDMETDFAYLWVDGRRLKFSRSSFTEPQRGTKQQTRQLRTQAQGGWDAVIDEAGVPVVEPFTGDVPVVVFENHDATGEFEHHTDLIDRINKGILDRLVMVAMQAFRQRALKGGLPQPGEGEQPIDYAAVFEPAPGALWDLPDGIEMWESQDTSQGILAALQATKDDIRDLASVTQTPAPMLMPDSANQSAEGARSSQQGLVRKGMDRLARIKPSVERWVEIALRVEDPDFDQIVSTSWQSIELSTLAERYDAAVKAQAAGVPWRTIMMDILGFSAQKVDEMSVERATDELTVESILAGQGADAA